ncbi:MAG: proton-conducting transporter transmembrane domain-containing protein, partial [Nitrospirota bacterium]
VVSDTENQESARAGLFYGVMTHIGTAFIIAAFMVMFFATGSLEFSAIRAGLGGAGTLRSVIFVLALIGFGTKAGIIPLHTWLPRAHPAAPSNVSALMSGVMIKSGIYGILLVSLDILGSGAGITMPLWWGVVVLSAGAVSSVKGIMYALMEKDIKRLLAYSSVENIGIILLGIGAAMIFSSNNLPYLAGLALAAALYHVFNHAAFKGLLFMSAGSAVHATGTKNMEEMGGLIKPMPWTGLFFLVGSVAICALPPFNGFMSEWLTFQSLVLGIKTPLVLTKTFMLLAGAALALTGALAASSFVKAFGITFLGVSRSQETGRAAKESSFSMLSGMGFLSVLCLLLGIFPGYMLRLISNIPLPGLNGLPQFTPGNFSVAGVGSSGVMPVTLLGSMLAGAAFIFVFPLLAGGRRKTAKADPWDCGLKQLTPRMQYTATAFTHPLRRIFKKIYKPRKEVRIEYIVKPFFIRDIEYRSEITPFFETYFYRPLTRALNSSAYFAKRLQSGNLQLYLGYILATLVVLLVVWG